MKKITLLLSVVLFASVIVQAQGIRFEEGSWKQVLEKAKQEGKIIFVDVYTNWCGPCKEVALKVFTQEKLGKFHNEHFINYKIDAENGEGPDFAKKYGVKAYPTYYYIDGDENIVFKSIGGQTADEFLERGKRMPLFASESVYKAIQEGKASPEMFQSFYEVTSKYELDEILNIYLKAMSPEIFLQEGYKRINDINLYDAELMNKLASMMVQQSKDARFTAGVYDSIAFSSIALAFEKKVSELLERSIQQDDTTLLNSILSLKNIYKEIPNRKNARGEVGFVPEQFMLVSPDYIRFCYGAENCTEQDFFREKFHSYMNALIEQNPTDWEKLKDSILNNPLIYSTVAEDRWQLVEMTSLNILNWVAYYHSLMPLNEEQTSQCVRYIKYACEWPFYEIALRAADLLVRLDATDECIALLEDTLALYRMRNAIPAKMKKKLQLKLQLVKEGRL